MLQHRELPLRPAGDEDIELLLSICASHVVGPDVVQMLEHGDAEGAWLDRGQEPLARVRVDGRGLGRRVLDGRERVHHENAVVGGVRDVADASGLGDVRHHADEMAILSEL